MYEFDWRKDQYDCCAAGIIAGHIIECGAQSTGGNFSLGWDSVVDPATIGYPIVAVERNGDFIVTKPKRSGGCVSVPSVTEQLVYEIGDPEQYVTPDVVADFSHLNVVESAPDSVRVTGARGKPPPEKLKISATYADGFKAEGTLVLVGPRVLEKARICREMVERRLALAGISLEEILFENLGSCACIPGMAQKGLYPEPGEIVFRVAARDHDRAKLERFTREIAPLVLSGPSGITGYAGGKGEVREVVSFWPSLIRRDRVRCHWEMVS
jgi:hypothetical protein